jgi:isoquinoline 1-oxidoreductase alpha subunit
MSAVALVEKNSNPSEQEIIQAMEGNLCRCGTYTRIKQAIYQAAEEVRNS